MYMKIFSYKVHDKKPGGIDFARSILNRDKDERAGPLSRSRYDLNKLIMRCTSGFLFRGWWYVSFCTHVFARQFYTLSAKCSQISSCDSRSQVFFLYFFLPSIIRHYQHEALHPPHHLLHHYHLRRFRGTSRCRRPFHDPISSGEFGQLQYAHTYRRAHP